ncbi:hypothetical protein NDU88_000909 [Pleurodeles waltl]|uniref:Uncharacterized protein n=1 Tax=Pleurodeles waltl TaxID=8319 RepID=A0AAV7U4V7_PLEWA|nr:hypothetical protein NDU88_000909 [Pleurodeles waltl]
MLIRKQFGSLMGSVTAGRRRVRRGSRKTSDVPQKKLKQVRERDQEAGQTAQTLMAGCSRKPQLYLTVVATGKSRISVQWWETRAHRGTERLEEGGG